MKLTITDRALLKQGLSIKDFGVLLYYIGGGTDNIHQQITKKLEEKGLVTTDLMDNVLFNKDKELEIRSWYIDGNTFNAPEQFEDLALKMMELFPKGSKTPGHPWRSNKMTVAQKLATLHFKFSADLSDHDKVLNATKAYVASFNGNYTYMQCLNYFILKRDTTRMEDMSALLSYMEQADDTAVTSSFDTGELI